MTSTASCSEFGSLHTLEQAVALAAPEHGQQGIDHAVDRPVGDDGDQGGDRQIEDVPGIKRVLAIS